MERQETVDEITRLLNAFDSECKNINYKKGIYIYGASGCGKTRFVSDLLTKLNYDIIKYDAGDVRNKSLLDTITNNNISNRNVLDMMNKTVKKIAIVMDEIDGMNNGDKGGITTLIKLIRQKKTKKQRLENITMNPIICIGNYNMDKKIKELMKVCNVFELKMPTDEQIAKMITNIPAALMPKIVQFVQGDLRKLCFIQNIYNKSPDILNEEMLNNIFQIKTHNNDSKKITQSLINKNTHINQHNICMNENDRTIVALLWHENIVDQLGAISNQQSIPFYSKILDNICYSDYIDRITFQNQIWQFNEMSSLMKTFHNNKIYHDTFRNVADLPEVRFTKVLTKYSTEYNNSVFIYNLCQELDIDKNDLVAMFQELRLKTGFNSTISNTQLVVLEKVFENYNVNKLDIKRVYRYLDKNIKSEDYESD